MSNLHWPLPARSLPRSRQCLLRVALLTSRDLISSPVNDLDIQCYEGRRKLSLVLRISRSGKASTPVKAPMLAAAIFNAPGSWVKLDSIWESDAESVLEDGLLDLSATWRLLLLSDGSVTRHLQLITGQQISIECLEMLELPEISKSPQNLPAEVMKIARPLVQRQVLLRSSDGVVLAYASSWWSSHDIKKHLQKVNEPIWRNFSDKKTELYRQVCRLYFGDSIALEGHFELEGPFWGRHYVFHQEERPLTVIYEVFSPFLGKYLGSYSTHN